MLQTYPYADIPPPTVQLLLAELSEVDWYVIGAALGVPVPTLREIQASNSQGGVQRWKIDMFQTWLDSTPNASWENVIRALEQCGRVTLAVRLKSKYIRQQLSTGVCVCCNKIFFLTICIHVMQYVQ